MFASGVYLSDFRHFLVFGNPSIYIAGLPNQIAGLLGDKHSTNFFSSPQPGRVLFLPGALGAPPSSVSPPHHFLLGRSSFFAGVLGLVSLPTKRVLVPGAAPTHPQPGRNSFFAGVSGAARSHHNPASLVFARALRAPQSSQPSEYLFPVRHPPIHNQGEIPFLRESSEPSAPLASFVFCRGPSESRQARCRPWATWRGESATISVRRKRKIVSPAKTKRAKVFHN